jgi:hypothetical protein
MGSTRCDRTGRDLRSIAAAEIGFQTKHEFRLNWSAAFHPLNPGCTENANEQFPALAVLQSCSRLDPVTPCMSMCR